MADPVAELKQAHRATWAAGEWDDVAKLVEGGGSRLLEEKFGPLVIAKAALGDRWPELRGDLVSLFDAWNRADDGSVRLEAEYLVTVGRKRG